MREQLAKCLPHDRVVAPHPSGCFSLRLTVGTGRPRAPHVDPGPDERGCRQPTSAEIERYVAPASDGSL
jgi:hypothetical protein